MTRSDAKTVVSLFSGIGGIEYGLSQHGFETVLFCEIDDIARAILQSHFGKADFSKDVNDLRSLPDCDVLTAGFPCQDLSQAGGKTGISGGKSGLVSRVFELLGKKRKKKLPRFLLIENVPYMLRLGRGHAMRYLTQNLEGLGYDWAYRVVDARSFGLPQRRPRVLLLASRDADPRDVLFSDNNAEPELDGRPTNVARGSWYGFYWTEGSRGVGWARDAVPPIKCGSTLGIASPPAVWQPKRDFAGTLHITDAERLQGFAEHWTDFGRAAIEARPSLRWRLVGNAVCTRMAAWVGFRLSHPQSQEVEFRPFVDERWPHAAWGSRGKRYAAKVSAWAGNERPPKLADFLQHELKPLSARATRGFVSRAETCTNVVYSPQFLESLRRHAERQERP